MVLSYSTNRSLTNIPAPTGRPEVSEMNSKTEKLGLWYWIQAAGQIQESLKTSECIHRSPPAQTHKHFSSEVASGGTKELALRGKHPALCSLRRTGNDMLNLDIRTLLAHDDVQHSASAWPANHQPYHR